jgi:hypothetical protein
VQGTKAKLTHALAEVIDRELEVEALKEELEKAKRY